jgi:hypothetical protein
MYVNSQFWAPTVFIIGILCTQMSFWTFRSREVSSVSGTSVFQSAGCNFTVNVYQHSPSQGVISQEREDDSIQSQFNFSKSPCSSSPYTL